MGLCETSIPPQSARPYYAKNGKAPHVQPQTRPPATR